MKLTIAILIALIALLMLAVPAQAQGKGNCGTDWIAKDENAPFVYDGDQIITKIIIKASTDCFGYTFTGKSMILTECYNISGLGTTRVKVSDAPDAPSSCHAISHVEFYASGEQPTLTPTRIATTPFKFWTFTPTTTPTTPMPTYTPTVTLTLPPNVTPTFTPEVTLTATPPDTLPPPPPRKTKTPQVLLPMTGEDNGALGTEELQWFFVVVFAGILFFVILRGMRKPNSE